MPIPQIEERFFTSVGLLVGKTVVVVYCDYVLKLIYLNGQNQIIEIADLAEGTVNSGVVFSRQVAESAIKHNASTLILAHNHPSGNPEPPFLVIFVYNVVIN
ncbi:JAB domain-containing protein [Chloroflexota bacterium]